MNNEEKNSMKAGCKVVALASLLLIFAFGLLYSGRSVSAASAGQITGTVKLDGTAPHQKPIDMAKEPSCAAVHKDKPLTTESVIAGANGGLANVVVYITQGLTGNEPVSTQPVEINQKGCQYLPHVVAVDAGQHVKIVNSDQTSHNIHPLPKVNREWNKSQPPGSPPIVEKYPREEFISVKCNVHPWMHGWFAVLKTNHYDVSKGGGDFKLPNLPPGKYTITAWHEDYGTQTADVTITGNETKDVNFTFKAKAY
jgi:plastocyanin